MLRQRCHLGNLHVHPWPTGVCFRENRPLSFLAGSYELGKTSFSRARGKKRKVGQKYSTGAIESYQRGPFLQATVLTEPEAAHA